MDCLVGVRSEGEPDRGRPAFQPGLADRLEPFSRDLAPRHQPEENKDVAEQGNSGGGGIGGGGGASGRPVAIIIIGPDGVTVKPVFDITKIALAGITAWGAMLGVLRRVRKASKG